MPETTQAEAFKDAMIATAHFLWDGGTPNVQVAFGHPGQTQLDDIVSFQEVTSEQDYGPIGQQRSRDEILTLTVIFSIYRPGGPEVEVDASTRAYKLLGDLENYVRKTDTTLGGVVQNCFLRGHAADGVSDDRIISSGRLVVIAAQFQAFVRIRTGS